MEGKTHLQRKRQGIGRALWEFTTETRTAASQNTPGEAANSFEIKSYIPWILLVHPFGFSWPLSKSFTKLPRVGWREEGRGRGRKWEGVPAGRDTLGVEGVQWTVSSRGRWGGRVRAPGEGKESARSHGRGRGGLFSENRERDFGGDVRSGASAFWGLCQLAEGAGPRVPVLSVIRRGRKWAGSVTLSGKSHIWWTQGREDTERNMKPWNPGWGRHPYFIHLLGVFQFTKHRHWHTETSQGPGRPVHDHYCPGEEISPRNKWHVWSLEFLCRSNVHMFSVRHLSSFLGAGLHSASAVRRALQVVLYS